MDSARKKSAMIIVIIGCFIIFVSQLSSLMVRNIKGSKPHGLDYVYITAASVFGFLLTIAGIALATLDDDSSSRSHRSDTV